MMYIRMTVRSERLITECARANGEEAQLDQLTEECGELIAVVNHYRRGRVTAKAVRSEMADVLAMLAAVSVHLGPMDQMAETLGKIERMLEGET